MTAYEPRPYEWSHPCCQALRTGPRGKDFIEAEARMLELHRAMIDGQERGN